MKHYITECKTEKTVVENIVWTDGRISKFKKDYTIGSQCMHPTKTKALNFIKIMNDKNIIYVLNGIYKTTNRRSK